MTPEWDTLDDAWRAAFEEAWDSWCAGSLGIGAAISDPNGDIVARGRNRLYEAKAPSNTLAGTRIAHAEINALAALPGDGAMRTITTTVEPCLLCMGAIRLSHIGVVRYAAHDSLWHGANELLASRPDVVRRWPATTGPCTAVIADFATVLHLTRSIERDPDDPLLALRKSEAPKLFAAANLALERLRYAAKRAVDVHNVHELLRPLLQSISAQRSAGSNTPNATMRYLEPFNGSQYRINSLRHPKLP